MRSETVGLIGAFVGIATLIAGIVQYGFSARRQLKQDGEVAKRELVKPFREAQLRLYEQATSAAAKLATLPRGTEEWTKAQTEFLRLYYGALAMVESQPVATAMINFKKCLDQETSESDLKLRNLSLALAQTCRQSLQTDWDVNLPQLQGK